MTASMAAVPAAVIPALLSVASLTFLIAGISVTEISTVLVPRWSHSWWAGPWRSWSAGASTPPVSPRSEAHTEDPREPG